MLRAAADGLQLSARCACRLAAPRTIEAKRQACLPLLAPCLQAATFGAARALPARGLKATAVISSVFQQSLLVGLFLVRAGELGALLCPAFVWLYWLQLCFPLSMIALQVDRGAAGRPPASHVGPGQERRQRQGQRWRRRRGGRR